MAKMFSSASSHLIGSEEFDSTSGRMITPAEDFRRQILGSSARRLHVAPQEGFGERGLLRMLLAGYASVYNVNTRFQLGWEKCSRLARGAQG